MMFRVLQASSPDEIALVQFAETLDYFMEARDTVSLTIRNMAGRKEHFTILDNFPFTSERKRMGIIVREEVSKTIMFYLKGADTAIMPKLGSVAASFVAEECENLAKDGLRTLVLCCKILTQKEYDSWKTRLQIAAKDLKRREAKESEVIDELEKDMELLGVTGVEDLLQDGIKTVIENLRAAGIKVWMLTGDKLETAKCISISTGIKGSGNGMIEIKKSADRAEFIFELEKLERQLNSVFIVEGDTLREIFADPDVKKTFIRVASMAPSVVCCRCSPTQKSEITEAIKNQLKKVVCGIGDGGNDVGMITSANVGIGIEGKEGKQAALAADFSIKTFKTLAPLALWSGRLSYVRTAKLTNFIIHRGLIISVIQFLFTLTYNFTTIQIYNGYLMLGYATVFTNLPVFSMVYDEDVSWRQVFDYPLLYKELQKGRLLSAKTFLLWAWMSIYQGTVIIMLSILMFDTPFLEIVTITFTSLIFIELLNVATSVHKFHSNIGASILISAACYLCCLLALKDVMMLCSINLIFVVRVVFITFCAWMPVKVVQVIKTRCYPSLLDKVRREDREKRRRQRQQVDVDEGEGFNF